MTDEREEFREYLQDKSEKELNDMLEDIESMLEYHQEMQCRFKINV